MTNIYRKLEENSIAHFYDDGILKDVLNEAGIEAVGSWNFAELALLGQGVIALANTIGSIGRLNELVGRTSFLRTTDGLGSCAGKLACTVETVVTFYDKLFSYSDSFLIRGTAVHELAHVIDFNFLTRYFAAGKGKFVAPSPVLPKGKPITSYGQTDGYLENWGEAVADWVYGASYKPTDSPRNQLAVDQREWIGRVLKGWGW